MFRRGRAGVEVFLVHPGGPFYVNKDAGVWSVPKGELAPGEPPLEVAVREFAEETGQAPALCASAPASYLALGSIRQRNGKAVHAWAFEGDWPEGATLVSNTFPLEWPPRSGRRREFPEVDRGEFFGLETAAVKINPGQRPLLERLVRLVDAPPGT